MTDDQIKAIAAQAQLASLLAQATIDLLAGKGVIDGQDAIAIYNHVALQAEGLGGAHNELVAAQCRKLAEPYQKRR